MQNLLIGASLLSLVAGYKLIETTYKTYALYEETKEVQFVSDLSNYYFTVAHFSEMLIDFTYINYLTDPVDVNIKVEYNSSQDKTNGKSVEYNYSIPSHSTKKIYQFEITEYPPVVIQINSPNVLYLETKNVVTITNKRTGNIVTTKLTENQISTVFRVTSRLYSWLANTIYLPLVSK